jgi:hypothetical protein
MKRQVMVMLLVLATITAWGSILIVTTPPVSQATATNVLTMVVNPTTNDTITINSDVYTFVTNAVLDGDVLIGANVTNTQSSLVAAFDSLITLGSFDTNNISIITAISGGQAANLITTSESFTSVSNEFTDSSMIGGVDLTYTQEDELLDTSFLYLKVSDTTWRKITLEDN